MAANRIASGRASAFMTTARSPEPMGLGCAQGSSVGSPTTHAGRERPTRACSSRAFGSPILVLATTSFTSELVKHSNNADASMTTRTSKPACPRTRPRMSHRRRSVSATTAVPRSGTDPQESAGRCSNRFVMRHGVAGKTSSAPTASQREYAASLTAATRARMGMLASDGLARAITHIVNELGTEPSTRTARGRCRSSQESASCVLSWTAIDHPSAEACEWNAASQGARERVTRRRL